MGYPWKNIPISFNETHLIKLIKINSAVKRICWSVYLFLEENRESGIWKEDVEFRSKNTPPWWEHTEAFEKEFLGMIPYIKFWLVLDKFLKKLKEDIPKIKQPPNIFFFPHKTSNILKFQNNNIKNIFMTTPQRI